MLNWLTRARRLRAAGVLAVLYLVCVLAPAAAFALGDASRAAHCLTDTSAHVHQTKAAADTHDHDDGQSPAHGHDQDDRAATPDQQCCGLFCVTTFPASAFEVVPPALPATAAALLTEQGVPGKAPDTLYRPPIA
jgi:hypothetical protein